MVGITKLRIFMRSNNNSMSDIKKKVLRSMAQGYTLISGLSGSPAWLSEDETGKTEKVPDVTLRSLLKDQLVTLRLQTLTTSIYKLTPKAKKK